MLLSGTWRLGLHQVHQPGEKRKKPRYIGPNDLIKLFWLLTQLLDIKAFQPGYPLLRHDLQNTGFVSFSLFLLLPQTVTMNGIFQHKSCLAEPGPWKQCSDRGVQHHWKVPFLLPWCCREHWLGTSAGWATLTAEAVLVWSTGRLSERRRLKMPSPSHCVWTYWSDSRTSWLLLKLRHHLKKHLPYSHLFLRKENRGIRAGAGFSAHAPKLYLNSPWQIWYTLFLKTWSDGASTGCLHKTLGVLILGDKMSMSKISLGVSKKAEECL